MFGYFSTFKDELKVKDYREYRRFYCGLCVATRNSYSVWACSLISYEAVFLSILLSDGSAPLMEKRRCSLFPLIKVPVLHSEIIDACSTIDRLFHYAKLRDHMSDHQGRCSSVLYALTRGTRKKAFGRLHRYAIEIAEVNRLLSWGRNLETQRLSFEEYTAPYGECMAYILGGVAESFGLDRLTYAGIGRRVAILMNALDAAEDYFSDQRDGLFNPLSGIAGDEVAIAGYVADVIATHRESLLREIMSLQHKHETLLLNIVGERIGAVSSHVINTLKSKGKTPHVKTQSRLVQYLRAL